MTKTMTNLLHSIAVRAGIDEDICQVAVETVLAYYAPSNLSDEELVEKLYLYIADSQETRAMVHQFRAVVREYRRK